MKIYFKTKKNIKNLKDLIKNGFTNRGHYGFKTTYLDSELTQQQCHKARRSFDDLLLISKAYFPNTTIKELAKVLFQLNKEINLNCFYCRDIEKLVFLNWDEKERMGDLTTVESQKVKGKSKYNFNMIKKLAES